MTERTLKKNDEILVSRRRDCYSLELMHMRIIEISAGGNILAQDAYYDQMQSIPVGVVKENLNARWYQPAAFSPEGVFKIEEFLN